MLADAVDRVFDDAKHLAKPLRGGGRGLAVDAMAAN